MYSRANQSPQSIFLTTKTSVFRNLVVPPHSGEKPTNKVWEAGKVINKAWVFLSWGFGKFFGSWLFYKVPSKGQNYRTDKISETSKAFTRQNAYYETKIRQEMMIFLEKSWACY